MSDEDKKPGLFGKKFKEKRVKPFQEWLSCFMVKTAAFGAFWVLLDPKATITDNNLAFIMNSGAFSNDLKGAVISAILIGGFTSVREFWLGTSKGGQESAAAVSRIAEATAPVVAATIATNGSGTGAIQTDEVKITAETATVTENPTTTERNP